jgi:hypothetical protein
VSTAATVAAPPSMRRALVPVLRRNAELGSCARGQRADVLLEVSAAFRAAGLVAVGVGELEVLAGALDGGES